MNSVKYNTSSSANHVSIEDPELVDFLVFLRRNQPCHYVLYYSVFFVISLAELALYVTYFAFEMSVKVLISTATVQVRMSVAVFWTGWDLCVQSV